MPRYGKRKSYKKRRNGSRAFRKFRRKTRAKSSRRAKTAYCDCTVFYFCSNSSYCSVRSSYAVPRHGRTLTKAKEPFCVHGITRTNATGTPRGCTLKQHYTYKKMNSGPGREAFNSFVAWTLVVLYCVLRTAYCVLRTAY